MPKVFVPILPGVTIWDAVHEKISAVTDHGVLVLSPEGRDFLAAHRADFTPESFEKTEIGLQAEPLGMGEAIFGVADLWRDYDDVLIVWGDQFNLSLETLRACVDLHATQSVPALTLPVVRAPQPYVEYVFDAAGLLTNVRQSREGDVCTPGGFSDLGVFLLSGGAALIAAWQRYRARGASGSVTGEINFLPFLIYLSMNEGWAVNRYETHDPAEAIGINTPADLAFARELLQKNRATPARGKNP